MVSQAFPRLPTGSEAGKWWFGATTREQKPPLVKASAVLPFACFGLSALFTVVEGSTKAFDQNCLIHGIWRRLAELDTAIWVSRVPTKENIADNPSRFWFCLFILRASASLSFFDREEYALLGEWGAKRCDAVLDPCFVEAQTWTALSMCAHK